MRAVVPVVGIGLLLVVAPAGAQAPGGARRGPPPRAAAEAPTDLPVLEMTLDPELERTKAQVEGLRQLVQSVLVPMGVLVGVLAGGALLIGVAGSVGALVWLRRARAAAPVPATAAGPAEEVRASREVLDATHRILALVHETLLVAKEATERATRAGAARVSARVAELEARAREALDGTGERAGALARPPGLAPLRAIAREVEAFEPHLTLAGGELPAACLLASGLAHRWRGEPDAGLEQMRAAARRATDPELAAMAHAWAGATLADLGRFGEGGEALRRALAAEPPGTARHAELERRRIECAFHEVPDDAADGAVEALDWELARLGAALEAASAAAPACQAVAALRGDVLTWAARRAPTPERRKALYDRAVAGYRQAGDTPWAWSGLLEARHALGEAVGAGEYHELLAETDEQLGTAAEPRAVAVLHAVRLLARARLGVPPAEREASYRELRAALRDVEPSVTLPSPRERRSIGRAAFEAEARALCRAADERSDAPAGDGGAARADGAGAEGPPRLAKAGGRAPAARTGARRGLPA